MGHIKSCTFALCCGMVFVGRMSAATYSESVVASAGVTAYYRMNEHAAKIGDPLINSAKPSALNGVWGFDDGNPDTLPVSDAAGPGSPFSGLESTNVAAYFGGNNADDDKDGNPSNNMSDQMDLGSPSEFDSEFASLAFFMRVDKDLANSRVFTTAESAEHTFRVIYGTDPFEGSAGDYNELLLVTNGPSGINVATVDQDLNDDRWHHIVVVRNGDEATDIDLYVDGLDITSHLGENPNSFGHDDGTARIGARHGTSNQGWGSFNGYLDEFAYWNRALSPAEAEQLFAAAIGGDGKRGDFDGNQMLDVADLDALRAEVIQGGNGTKYDVTNDGTVDIDDVVAWVTDFKKTWVGDADLDGQFNSADLITVFVAGKYEAGSSATWGEGDWTANGRFDSDDLIAAFVDGGYESGPRVATWAVPETASVNGAIGVLIVRLFCIRGSRSK